MNTRTLAKPQVVTGDAIFRVLGQGAAVKQYNYLLSLLYPGRSGPLVPWDDMRRNLDKPHHHFVFVVVDGQIVATARAVLDDGGPDLSVIIGDVITHDQYRRNGYGTVALNALVEQSFSKWSNGRPITYCLTNNPHKGNGTFYAANGWHEHDTVVWVKPIHSSA
tara:strand:+ start:248 stop:739 length:492 start_codon:yes stop_codon:yes gene_type:complete